MGDGQVQRERAADADFALDVQLTAEQARDLPADRQPKPGATEPPTGGAICLLERFEDQSQLFVRHTNAGVGHAEGDDLDVLQRLSSERPVLRRFDAQTYLSALGELERVRQQVA